MVVDRERFGYATILRFAPVICGAVVAKSQPPCRRHSITASRSLCISLARAVARFDDSRTDPGIAMRFGLSGALLGLMLAACVDRPPQFYAGAQRQTRYSACGDEACNRPRPATKSLAMTTSPATDGVPDLDVEPVCRGIAEQGGATVHEPVVAHGSKPETVDTKKDCVNSEQRIRNQLMTAWERFDAADRAHCVTESEMGGESSYTELITCLEMARDVRKLHQQTVASRSAHNIDTTSSR
jgi:hypothetical protein